MEKDEQAERLEREVRDMEERSGKLGEHIDSARSEWETKEADPAVPGAQADEEEQGMDTPEESDQLPEEGPSEQVHDDSGEGGARKEAEDSPGARDEKEGTATGNPDAAGSDE